MHNSTIFSQSAESVGFATRAQILSLDPLAPGSVQVVIGAPKSGKTSQLRLLVQQLESNGHDPDEILVLTPSRPAANQLRVQIALESKKPASKARARTVSSLAFGLVQSLQPQKKLLSGAAQELLIRDLMESSIHENSHKRWGFDLATLKLQGFRAEVRDLLQVVLENQLDLSDIEVLSKKYPKLNLRVLTEILPKYTSALEADHLVDPSQLLVDATRASKESLRSYRFVFVDDAVDLSIAGLSFIKELAVDKALVLFGDPDVATQGFRSAGAAGFIETFPKAKRHFLSAGVSLTAPVSELAAKLVAKLPTSLAGPQRLAYQTPNLVTGTPVSALVFDNPSAEADYVATILRKARLQQNLDWGQMIVVARTRNQLDLLSSDLASRSVPTRVLGIQTPLSKQFAARSVLMVAKAAFSKIDSDETQLLLASPFCQLDSLGVRRLLRQLAMLDENQGISHSNILGDIFESEVEPITPEFKKLNRLIALIQSCKDLEKAGAHELVSRIWQEGPAKSWQILARGNSESAMAANRDLDSVLALFAAAIRFDERGSKTAADFVSYQLEISIPEDSLANNAMRPAVILATPSQLSGLSAEVVILPRLQEGIWPNLKPRSSLLGAASLQAFLAGKLDSPEDQTRSELADESRMLLKAITTCTDQLVLTCTSTLDEQPSQFFPMLGLQPEAQTAGVDFDLRRLVGRLRKSLSKGDLGSAPVLAALALAGAPGAHPDYWQGLLPLSSLEPIYGPDQEVRISASKVEAFEKCPLHWFIGTFGGDSSGFEASLGTLIHAALEASKTPGDLESYLESNWHTLEFETAWQATAQKRKARSMLLALTQYLEQSGALLQAEAGFSFHLGRLNISGKIDRIEHNADGTLSAVDLKTGRTPTRAAAAANRQIALYQLAVQDSYPDSEVAGGKLVYIGQGKLSILEQPKLEGEARQEVMDLLAKVELGAGGNSFEAHFDEHCSQDGKCQLLIGKVITNA